MTDQLFNLAIESSTRSTAVALGRVGDVAPMAIASVGQMQASELMAMIERLCDEHGVKAGEIGELYISVGPGSFTGLRVGIATVKAMAQVTGAKVVAVPTLEVVAQNTPAEVERVGVCLNQKRDTVYAGIFEKVVEDEGEAGVRWGLVAPAALVTLEALIASAGDKSLALLGDPLPALPECEGGEHAMLVLPAELVQPRVEAVWAIGAAMGVAGRFTDPMVLVPSYIRPPEAVELWAKRKAMKK